PRVPRLAGSRVHHRAGHRPERRPCDLNPPVTTAARHPLRDAALFFVCCDRDHLRLPPERRAVFLAPVLRACVFLGALGSGSGRMRTNWIGLPLARMRSSTSMPGSEARNLFRLLEPKLRTSKSG